MRAKKEIVDGKIQMKRSALSKTDKSIELPLNPIWLKQSNLITLMNMDYSVIQLRTLICVVEKIQGIMEEVLLGRHFEQLSLFPELHSRGKLTLMIKYADLGVKPYQYKEVKAMLKELATIAVELDSKDPISGDDCWTIKGLMTPYVRENAYSKFFTIDIDRDIVKMFLEINHGFTKYMKQIAFRSQSKYTIRIYSLISAWKNKGGFSIRLDKFRKWLGLQSKYPSYNDLYRRTIKVAYEELHENADCWFEVSEIYDNPHSKEPYKLNFKVVSSLLVESEKAVFEKGIEAIGNMLRSHIHMPEAKISRIVKMISPDNIQDAMLKLTELISYVKQNIDTIKHPEEYCEKSMSAYLAQEEIDIQIPKSPKKRTLNCRKLY